MPDPKLMPDTIDAEKASSPKSVNPIWRFLGTGFYSGYAPVASGTAGSLVALILYYFIPGMELTPVLLTVAVLTTLIGIPAATAIANVHGEDPSIVVIDEFAGQFVALLFFPKTIAITVLAFFLFRAFDIVKPPPARQAERLAGGTGIMLDDIVAGIYANLSIRLILWIFPALGQ